MSWFQPSFMPIVSALGIGLMVGLERERKKDRKTDSSTIAGLRTLLARRGNYEGGDQAAFIERDLAFHKAVIAASGNRAMIELYDFFSASIAGTIAAFSPERPILPWATASHPKATATQIRPYTREAP